MNAPDFSLDAKVALVTGAGRGIGLAMAKALASRGCAVALQDVDQDVASAEVEAMRRQGARAIALGGDLREVSIAEGLVERTVSGLGGLHILINNGAIQKRGPWTEATAEEIAAQQRANLVMPIRLCQIAVPHMRRGGYGRVINLGSITQRGLPQLMPYAMTKSATDNMTRALAKDLAPLGITVNIICPGWFNTFRNRAEFAEPGALEQGGKRVPLGRVGEPEDCGGIALLLCSPAGGYITGQTIFIDGGMSA